MEQEKESKLGDYLLALSMIIGAIMISGALIYSAVKSQTKSDTIESQNSNEQEAPAQKTIQCGV